MSRRRLIALAILSNLGVLALTYAFGRWSSVTAHAGARNTARFSGLWFLLAFAAPILVHWLPRLPAREHLFHAFVGAHLVHFTAVAILRSTFEANSVLHKPVGSVLSIAVGLAIILGAGFTVEPRASSVATVIHKILLYLVLLIFFLGYLNDPARAFHCLAIVFPLALLLRLASRWLFGTRASS